jgi:hypothetical protein
MSQCVNSCRSLSVCAIVAAASIFGHSHLANASNIWDGGGGADRRWSNPLNWSDDQLPSNSGSLVLSGSSTQDLFTATGGVPNSSFSLIEGVTNFGVSSGTVSSALGIADNGRIVGGGFGLPLVTAGDIQFDPPTASGTSFRSIIQQPGAVTNVIIGSSPAYAGSVSVQTPGQITYTGATAINHGTLSYGILGARVNTSNQGNYTIATGAALFASGTIGLTAGGRIENAGTIGTTGDGPNASLNIIGDLRMLDGSTVEVWLQFTAQWFNAINATRLLDLTAASDTLLVRAFGLIGPGQSSAVLSNYGSRIGEFDHIVGLQPWMSIAYTSAANAGPGQVLLVVPEPTSVMLLGFAALSLLVSRRRRLT